MSATASLRRGYLRMKRITIKDIAAASGYSKTAVSFAFNRPERISEEARRAIFQAAERLGYIPDPFARNLSRCSSDTIGLLLPQPVEYSFENPYLVDIVRGVGRECHVRQKSLSIIPPVKGRLPELAGEAAVDGMIAIGLDPDDELLEALRRRELPFVTIDGDAVAGVPSVGIDDRKAAKTATEHLLSLGHRHILVLGLCAPDPPVNYRYSSLHARRLAGIHDAFDSLSLVDSPDDVLIFESCELTPDAGAEAVRRIFSSSSEKAFSLPTAIFAFSDIIAAGALRALRELDIPVPRSVSVLAFDGSSISNLTVPRLSSIVQPGEEKGSCAAAALFSLIRGDKAESAILPFSLRLGDSLAPPFSE